MGAFATPVPNEAQRARFVPMSLANYGGCVASYGARLLSLCIPTLAASHALASGWANFSTRLRRWVFWAFCLPDDSSFVAGERLQPAHACLQRSRSLTTSTQNAQHRRAFGPRLGSPRLAAGIRDGMSRGMDFRLQGQPMDWDAFHTARRAECASQLLNVSAGLFGFWLLGTILEIVSG